MRSMLLPMVALCCLCANQSVTAQFVRMGDTQYDDWLTSVDGQLMFTFRIDVRLPGDVPASEFNLEFDPALTSGKSDGWQIEGNRITVRMTTGGERPFPVMQIHTRDGRFTKSLRFGSSDVRQWARNGILVTLDPVRMINLKVVNESGEPVAGARMPGTGRESDAKGLIRIPISANDRLARSRLNVIGPDGSVGTAGVDHVDEFATGEIGVQITRGVRQTIRVIDTNGSPRPGINIIPQPRDRNIRCISDSGFPVRTDGAGEADITWLPMAPGANASIDMVDKNWVSVAQERTDQVWTVTVAPIARQTISGKITGTGETENPGGILVRLTSFDHPAESKVDQLYCYTDPAGRFSAEVIPGAVYCVYVADSSFVSDAWSGVIVDQNGEIRAPELTVNPGIPLDISSTCGPDRSPVAHQSITVSWEHRFKSADNSPCIASNYLYVYTDEYGFARAHVAAGQVKVAVLDKDYVDRKDVVVTPGKANAIGLHRKSIAAVPIAGRVLPEQGRETDFSNVHVKVLSCDGKVNHSSTAGVSQTGEFRGEGVGERFVILATTADESASGYVFREFEELDDVSLQLIPHNQFAGRLVDQGNQPLANRKVELEFWFQDEHGDQLYLGDPAALFSPLQGKTDAEGRFQFDSVPVSVPFTAWTFDGPGERRFLGQHMLLIDDERKPVTYRISPPDSSASASPEEVTFDQRWQNFLSYLRVTQANGLVILSGEGEETAAFARDNLSVFADNKDLFWYIPIVLAHGQLDDPVFEKMMRSRQWELPGSNQVRLIAIREDGGDLESITLDINDDQVSSRIAEFLGRNRPDASDATQKLADALLSAEKTGRRVWVVTGNTRCGPCIRFAQWIETQSDLLEQDYVFVKVDTLRDDNALEIESRITSGRQEGVPFHAILGAGGQVAISSRGVMGNIGFPSSHEGRYHLRKMLKETRSKLTDEQIEYLVNSLDN